MSSLSKALQVFVAQQPAAMESAPLATPLTTLSYLSFLNQASQYLGWLSSSKPPSRRPVLVTNYGLRLEQIQRAGLPPGYSVHLEPPAGAVDDDGDVGGAHYRIFPDWQTSFFWRDAKFFHYANEESTVEDEEIEAFYPRFAPAFFEWREVYEVVFEKQELHLGSKKELFLQLEERVAWDVEGFMMAAWLVLQPDVETVEYSLDGKVYLLRKDSVDAELNSFLGVVDLVAKDTNLQGDRELRRCGAILHVTSWTW